MTELHEKIKTLIKSKIEVLLTEKWKEIYDSSYDMMRWCFSYEDASVAEDESTKHLAEYFLDGIKGYKDNSDEEILFETADRIIGEMGPLAEVGEDDTINAVIEAYFADINEFFSND